MTAEARAPAIGHRTRGYSHRNSSSYAGRKRADDRGALAGIVFVLKTGIAWNQLPHAVSGVQG